MEGCACDGLEQAIKKLNEAQRCVVDDLDHCLLVMAPAGTEKRMLLRCVQQSLLKREFYRRKFYV